MILTDNLTASQQRLYALKRKFAKSPDQFSDTDTKQLAQLISQGYKPLFVAGRYTKPNVSMTDLCNFDHVRSKAVIDYLDISIETQRATNFQTVRRAANLPPSYVTPLDDKNSGKRFTVRLHDISKFSQIDDVLQRINAKCPLAPNVMPTLGVLELAFDFYGQPPELLASLTQSLVIPADLNNIRLYKKECHSVKFNPNMPAANAVEYFKRGYVFGIGHRDDQHAAIKYRAYYKVTNNKANLPSEQHRLRIEVIYNCNGAPLSKSDLAELIRYASRHLRFYQLNDRQADHEQRYRHSFMYEPKSRSFGKNTPFKRASKFNKNITQSTNDLVKTLNI